MTAAAHARKTQAMQAKRSDEPQQHGVTWSKMFGVHREVLDGGEGGVAQCVTCGLTFPKRRDQEHVTVSALVHGMATSPHLQHFIALPAPLKLPVWV